MRQMPHFINDGLWQGRCFHQSELVDVFEGELYQHGASQKVAIKKIRCVGGRNRLPHDTELMETHLKLFTEESEKWRSMNHPNVVPVLSVEIAHEPYIVNPYHGCTLATYLKQNAIEDRTHRLALLKQVTDGLAYLHSRDPEVIHGGLSLHSILMDQNERPMLSNFGLEPFCRRVASDIVLTSGSGLVNGYLSAPEIWMPETEYPTYTKESDAFDFGSLVLEVFSGRMPFKGENRYRTIMRIMNGGKPLPEDHPALPEKDYLWSFIYACWSFDPKERPPMHQLSTILNEMMLLLQLQAYQAADETMTFTNPEHNAFARL